MDYLRNSNPTVAILDLSRNFAKEIAVTAGLDHAHGDAVVIIDANLQDPPELISQLIRHWIEGYDVVYAKRIYRKGESFKKRAISRLFCQTMQTISQTPIPEDTGDFRLLSRRAVESLKLLREQHRFMKGLCAWIGYPQEAVSYQRGRRHAGQTKWSYWSLWNFALEGITSFTIAPLKAASYLGLITALVAFLYAGFIIYKTLVFGGLAAGYPSLMVVILFLAGAQLITIGVIGEYLGRMFDQSKKRPLYFLRDYKPSAKQKT